MAKNDDWLARTDEPVLDPTFRSAIRIITCGSFATSRSPPRPRSRRAISSTRSSRTSASGHNVVSTVFIECGAMFRATGPEEFRPIGETEFVAGVAAMSESGRYGPTRVAAGIVGTADLRLETRRQRCSTARLRLGAAVSRHPPGCELGCEPGGAEQSHRAGTPPVPRLPVSGRVREPRLARTHVRGLVLSPPDPGSRGSRPRVSRHHHHPRSLRRPPRHRTVRGSGGRGLRRLAPRDRTARRVSQRARQARGHRDGHQRFRVARTPGPADERGADGGDAPLLRAHHRDLRRRALHVRVELPGRQGELQLPCAVELVQAPHRGVFRERACPPLPRHRGAGLPPRIRDPIGGPK